MEGGYPLRRQVERAERLGILALVLAGAAVVLALVALVWAGPGAWVMQEWARRRQEIEEFEVTKRALEALGVPFRVEKQGGKGR